MDFMEIESVLEAILFTAGKPVSIDKISTVMEIDKKNLRKHIKNLALKYEKDGRGIVILEVDDSYQMCTNPDYFEYIKKFYKTPQRKALTQTLMESLAIIAYKQPITRAQIEEIRGVNADHALNKLMEYNLICEKGRADLPGKPIMFGTTEDFLKYFGYKNLSELPELNEDVETLRLEVDFELEGNNYD